jgi:hypothetical protein
VHLVVEELATGQLDRISLLERKHVKVVEVVEECLTRATSNQVPTVFLEPQTLVVEVELLDSTNVLEELVVLELLLFATQLLLLLSIGLHFCKERPLSQVFLLGV